ncbi:methyl-accepting chemotaxis protein [Sneathiella sp.]|jgi:methyl-accepting chemotaxis protein|uniref:methyl-accepting chemotaxis protein n=1 Tax=Sneathiella sp. TaxID=1964365 RepID=UPI0039E3F670
MFGLFGGKEKTDEKTAEASSNDLLKAELEAYKAAFASLQEVTERVQRGDMEARITDWDCHGDLSPTLAGFNQTLDLTDSFIRESTASLSAATAGIYYRRFLDTGMRGRFGDGARQMNSTIETMQQMNADKIRQRNELSNSFEQSIGEVVQILSATVSQVASTSLQLKEYATENQNLASTVAAAAEEATVNVQTVSAASEQLSASVQEIARQVAASSTRTSSASEDATLTSETIQQLKGASENIGMTVGLIKDIADQTNLLALNATIEAARAGEAGKGFAVVASEVKSLAQQTTNATGEVDQQVQSIQGSTESTVLAVQKIADSILQLNEITSSIASATEEQTSATLEISRNIQEASQGTNEVAVNISKVYDSATSTLKSADELDAAASQLNATVLSLQKQSAEFLQVIKAA